MPVRFVVEPHEAKPVHKRNTVTQAQDIFDARWGKQRAKNICRKLLQSSLQSPEKWPLTQVFDPLKPPPGNGSTGRPGDYLPSIAPGDTPWDISHLSPQSNGFIFTVVEAYNQHYHLIIRPDDVWLAILCQFNHYVNANSKSLRKYFVAHKGKKVVGAYTEDSLKNVDLARKMAFRIEMNVLDKQLKDWIIPNFTTTTDSDVLASVVMMMATLKAYLKYTEVFYLCGIPSIPLEGDKQHWQKLLAPIDRLTLFRTKPEAWAGLCGIPSITLEGDKQDWQKLLARIDRLKLFGLETEAWAAMLRPILKRFVYAFDGQPDTEFWSHICQYHAGSGGDSLSGWISAFSVWNQDGKWMNGPVNNILAAEERCKRGAIPPSIRSNERSRKLEVNGIRYPTLQVDDMAQGFCDVNVMLDEDGGEVVNSMMVSGHVATRVEGVANDVVRPHPAWFTFKKKKPTINYLKEEGECLWEIVDSLCFLVKDSLCTLVQWRPFRS